MVQRMMEGGYTLGASAALQARQFDERHRLSETARVRAEELRQSAAAAGKGSYMPGRMGF